MKLGNEKKERQFYILPKALFNDRSKKIISNVEMFVYMELFNRYRYICVLNKQYNSNFSTNIDIRIKHLSRILNVSSVTIKRAIKNLNNNGYIEIVRQGSKNTYQVLKYLNVGANVKSKNIVEFEKIKRDFIIYLKCNGR